jgi:hypothetical protein
MGVLIRTVSIQYCTATYVITYISLYIYIYIYILQYGGPPAAAGIPAGGDGRTPRRACGHSGRRYTTDGHTFLHYGGRMMLYGGSPVVEAGEMYQHRNRLLLLRQLELQ